MNIIRRVPGSLSLLFALILCLFVLPANAAVSGTVDAAGNVVDSNGQVIGHVVIGPIDTAGRILEGPVNAGGDIIDSTGRVIGHVASGSPFTAGTIIKGTITRSGTIIDSSGNVVGYDFPSSGTVTTTTTTSTVGTMTDVLADSIDTMRAQLAGQINSGLTSGKLTNDQADVFTAELNSIGRAEGFAKASEEMLTFNQGLSFANDLDRLNANVATAAGLTPFDSLVLTDSSGATKVALLHAATAPRVALKTTIVKETTVKSDVYLVTIDTRRHELEKVIADGMDKGKLTQRQADDLRSELDAVTQLELAAKKYGGAIPYEQIAVIATRLDVVGQRMSEIVGFPIVPIIENGRFIVFNGEIIQLDEIAMRRATLEGKISLALAHNTLSNSQVANVRTELDNIAAMEVRFRGNDINGEFTDQQARDLFQAFDHVGGKLDAFIASNKGKPVTGVY
jgi:hypothetical protein